MQSLRKIMYKPRVDDWSPLAKFYYADESLNAVAAELDSFDGRRDPDRCNRLVNKLRQCQDRVLQIIEELLSAIFPNESDRAPRDFRVKFPDDILHENLPGQLWFGAECLSAGSNIIDHEFESEAIRPLARSLTRHLDKLREILKDQSLKNPGFYPDKLKKSLRIFDRLFAEFELNYVSAMVPVKSVQEYDAQLDVAVLFSETLIRAIDQCHITKEQIEDCDPSIMITLPRLAIVAGLFVFPFGPLDVEKKVDSLPEMFRPFQTLLQKIRDLLHVLSPSEMATLEKALCSQEEPQLGSNVTLIADYRNQSTVVHGNESEKPEIMDHCDDDLSLNPNIALPSGSPSSVDEILETQEPRKTNVLDSGSKTSGDTVNCPSSENSIGDFSSPRKSQMEEEKIDGDRSCTRVSGSSECSDSTSSVVLEESESGDPLVRIGVEAGSGEEPEVEITSWELDRFCRKSETKGSKETEADNSSNRELGLSERLAKNRAVLRSRFKSPEDLIHRLFVCIAGVADQLQTNYPADLRSVLKMVLQPNETIDVFEVNGRLARGSGREEEVGIEVHESLPNPAFSGVRWVPDNECAACIGCQAMFTLVRRRHHCRNCGQIFCGRCSVNNLPLPELGYNKAVRVCNGCFLYKLNPFTSNNSAPATSGNSSAHLDLRSSAQDERMVL